MVTNLTFLPYMVGLSLSNFIQLINNPLLHDPNWPIMPTKHLSDILKFEGNPGKNPTDHVHSFHMWCLSHSITKDSIHLRLFQRTLIGVVAKLFVDQPHPSHSTFMTLAKEFLSYF